MLPMGHPRTGIQGFAFPLQAMPPHGEVNFAATLVWTGSVINLSGLAGA